MLGNYQFTTCILKANASIFSKSLSNCGVDFFDFYLLHNVGYETYKRIERLGVFDLSFFYDMNAAGIRHVGNNVRIILLNNGGGAEFHFFMSKTDIPALNTHMCRT